MCVSVQSVRSLENNLEKMQLKCEKAKEIRRHYEEIKAQLQVSLKQTLMFPPVLLFSLTFAPSLHQSECLEFPGRLDRLEAELLKAKEELHRMEDVKKKTQLAKDTAEVTRNLHHVFTLPHQLHASPQSGYK